RDDFQVVAVAQLAGDGPEDACSARVALVVDQHGGVLVEADVAAIRAAELLGGPYDNGAHHVTLLDRGIGDGLLDGGDDHVADAGGGLLRAAEDADALDGARARVVGHTQAGGGLNHAAPSPASAGCSASVSAA